MILLNADSKTVLRLMQAALVFSALAAAATPPLQVAPDSVSLCNTGLRKAATQPGCGGRTEVPSRDTNWGIAIPWPTATQSDVPPLPCGAFTRGDYDPAWVGVPNPAWYNPDSLSQWIMPDEGAYNPDSGWYVYGIFLYLKAAGIPPNPSGIVIAGKLLSDTSVWSAWLETTQDGKPGGCYPMTSSPTTSLYPITPSTPDPNEQVAQALPWSAEQPAGFPNYGLFENWTSFRLSNTAPLPSNADKAILYFVLDAAGGATGLRVEFNNPPLPSSTVPAGVTFTYTNIGPGPYWVCTPSAGGACSPALR